MILFCYGLLCFFDMIRFYWFEGDVWLFEFGNRMMFDYWKLIFIDWFIVDIKKVGGVFCNLVSDEMWGFFDWKWVEKEVCVIIFEFYVWKNGKLVMVVVYIKMLWGEMICYILKNWIEFVE